MKKTIITFGVILILFILTFLYIKPTRIALVNFRDFQVAEFIDIIDNRWIKVDRIDINSTDGKEFKNYRMLLFFGMGLNLSENHRINLKKASEKGSFFHVFAATSPDNDISNLEGKNQEYITGYLNNGGKRNIQELFNYTRRILDNKKIFSKEIKEPLSIPSDSIFHIGEEAFFAKYKDYIEFYKKNELFKQNKPSVAIITSIVGPRSTDKSFINDIINEFEKADFNVFGIAGFSKRLDYLKEISPDIVIYMPHGRLIPGHSEPAVAWLKSKNIPLLVPIAVKEPYENWTNSQLGMSGGFLSQSITVPELDGGIEPFAISADFLNEHNLYVSKVIPDRLNRLVKRAKNWIELKSKNNSDKKIAIVYYKEAGNNAMVAAGMEVAPSLLNLLKKLKSEGYNTGPLPENEKDFFEIINKKGPVIGNYAHGAIEDFLNNGNPELINVKDFNLWAKKSLKPEMIENMKKQYGEAPGDYLGIYKNNESYIAIPRVEFGNIVLMPQLMAGYGNDTVNLVHGAKTPPPYPYATTYLWAENGFRADAIIHFGTHGSFEFMPSKQTGLSSYDWSDALIGNLPHLYYYVINNIGEAVIAKRRSYATLISHLTPPFMESELHGPFMEIHDILHNCLLVEDNNLKSEYYKALKEKIIETDLWKDLNLDSTSEIIITDEFFDIVHNYIHTIGAEKITKGLYTSGTAYTVDEAEETARNMTLDGISWSLARIDVINGKVTNKQLENKHFFEENYIDKALHIIDEILSGKQKTENFFTQEQLELLKNIPDDKTLYYHVKNLFDNINNILNYKNALLTSPEQEFSSILNGLSGGYISPSSGGDPIANPASVPTGRNMYSINAEITPTQQSWELGKKNAVDLIKSLYAKNGKYPEKVVFTLWGGEFIRKQGVEIATIFYLLGVEPVRNARGSVYAVKLIPSEELGRPRIDVVVQTSGQFRDIASSRIFLIEEAVAMAAQAYNQDKFENFVRKGSIMIEETLKKEGFSPLDAQKMSHNRVFGGLNGNYGTGTMGLVEKGDAWEDSSELAENYINNMGTIYSKENWGTHQPEMFRTTLENVEAVAHNRSSNTTGPLSLDHVYEFMGGINNAVKTVSGNDPSALFIDNRSNYSSQVVDAKQAIWTEARTTVLNPKYIENMTNGGASSAAQFAEVFRNTYAWNVLKESAIDNELWDNYYKVYVEDNLNLNIREFFEDVNPYALQEMTAVMLETVRKNLWDATDEQIQNLVDLHVELINDFDPGCSGFVCDNQKLSEMIADMAETQLSEQYMEKLNKVKTASVSEQNRENAITMKKEEITLEHLSKIVAQNFEIIISLLSIILIIAASIYIGVKRKNN